MGEMFMEREMTEKKEKIHFDTYFLILYMLTLPLDFVNIGGLGSVSKLVAVAVVGTALLSLIKSGKISVKLFLLFDIYLAWNYLSATYSLSPRISFDRANSLLQHYLMILICGSTKKNKREMDAIVKSLVLSGWVVVLLMFVFGGRLGYSDRTTIKINGVSQDPNYMCGYIIFTLMYCFDEVLSRKKLASGVIGIGAMLTAVLYTGSRGGMIAVLAACAVLYLSDKSNKKKIRNIIIIAVVAYMLFVLAQNILPEELLSRYGMEYTKNDSGAGRFMLWQTLIEKYKGLTDAQKLIGVGSGTIKYYLPNVAHNLWLETMFELGFVGLVLLVAVYLVFVKDAFGLNNKIFFSSLIGYIALSQSTSLYTYKPIFTMFLIIYILTKNRYDEAARECSA